jgi:DNA (cytosine-5)-methyltransferase 1
MYILDVGSQHAVAFDAYNQTTSDKAAALRTAAGGVYDNTVMTSQVRRLTPTECERLQGFPDNFTQIPWRNKAAEDCPDGPRYKAMGNSMAVPVMRWIGERIDAVEGIDQ